jgi:transposase
MRKSFDGLSGEVRQHLGQDPTNGDYFVFVNRRCALMKILVWDRHGFWVLAKRLEAGRFRLPSQRGAEAGTGLLLPWEELLCIIEGIDVSSLRRRKRFSLEVERKSLTNGQ